MSKHDDSLVIVGMGCRLPGANSTDEYWKNLLEGKISTDAKRVWDNGTESFGGFLDDIQSFDEAFFNVSPAEAVCMSPQLRLLLEVSYHAIQSAALSIEQLRELNTGVFTSSLPGDYKNLLAKDADAAISPYSFSGNAPSAMSGRLSYFYDIHGPSLSIDTACSSGLSVLSVADMAIRQGQCQAALIGAASLFCTSEFHQLASESKLLSPDNRCYAFDSRANGFVPSEGVVVLVVMQRKTAQQYKLPILASVRQLQLNHDGLSNGLMAPNAAQQASLIKRCHAAAGVSLDELAIFEAHGTGTTLGDAIECVGLNEAFDNTDVSEPCNLGASKMVIGHTLVCSALSSIVKLILSHQHALILGNPLFIDSSTNTLDKSVFRVNQSAVQWPQGKRFAAVSAFGFTGSNAHLILEFEEQSEQRGYLFEGVFAFSADNPVRLQAILESTLTALDQETLNLSSLSTYLIRQPKIFNDYRVSMSAASRDDLKNYIRECLASPADQINRKHFGHRLSKKKVKAAVSQWLSGKSKRLTDNVDLFNYSTTLPLFPFNRNRYWIGVHESKEAKGCSAQGVEAVVKHTLNEVLSYPLESINISKSLLELGLDSLSGISFSKSLQDKGASFNPDLIWSSSSLKAFIASCSMDQAPSNSMKSTQVELKRLNLSRESNSDLDWIVSSQTGTPIFLLPPLNCGFQAWSRQIVYLHEHGYKVFIPCYPTQPNRGTDEIDLHKIAGSIRAMLAKQSQQVHLVGWSLGGVLGQILAIAKTPNIASLTMVATAVSFSNDFLEQTITMQQELVEFELVLKIALQTNLPISEFIRDNTSMSAVAAYYKALTELAITPEQLASIQVPTLIVVGTKDPIITMQQRNLLAQIKGASTKIYEKGGHFIPLCHANLFNKALIEFLLSQSLQVSHES